MKKALLYLVFLLPVIALAQRPSGVPQDTGPLKLESAADYIIFIILPIVTVVLYFLWRAKEKKEKQGESE